MPLAGVHLLALLSVPAVSFAHVLDEYVQASRIDLQRDGIVIELSLTPGVEIAPMVLGQIDTNRDGALSDQECEGYARRVLRDLSVTVRHRPLTPALVACRCPTYRELRTGVGTIQLRAATPTRIDMPGRHRVVYRNAHQAERAAYAVNALVPGIGGVSIASQERDPLQRELRLEYVVTGVAGAGLMGWGMTEFVAVGLLVVALMGRSLARRYPRHDPHRDSGVDRGTGGARC
jgi:hypothetical protein